MTTDVAAEREINLDAMNAERARDLRKQIADLGDVDEQEVIFKETSPARRKIPLYSMEDGSTVLVYKYRLEGYLARNQANGQPQFTADPSKAPAFVRGDVKCFLAEGSPEKAKAMSLGIGKTCKAVHLPSRWHMEQHAAKKHRAEWSSYKASVEQAERNDDRDLRRLEVEAMMALAKDKAAK